MVVLGVSGSFGENRGDFKVLEKKMEFPVGFWRIMGNNRQFSDPARELLEVFERMYWGVL